MRLDSGVLLGLLIGLAPACEKGDNADEPRSSAATASPEAPAPAPAATRCAALSITIDGEPLNVGSVHAYTGVSDSGEVFGEFVRASEAADESCAEILANAGVSRDGQSVRAVIAFASPESAVYDSLMITGWSQAGVALDYVENPDSTRTICVEEATRFTGPGGHEYVVVGELSGPHCGNIQI